MTLKQQLIAIVTEIVKDLEIEIIPSVDYPADIKHGDYTTNIALVVFGNHHVFKSKAFTSPRELAEEIVERLRIADDKLRIFEKIEIAGPGFINFWVKNDILFNRLLHLEKLQTPLTGKKIMVEFAHPNTHKAFHIGHLRNITTGESIVRLLEAVGVKVIRVNYQGDVGMHIAKCLYGILQNSDFKTNMTKLKDVKEKIDFLGKAYAAGSKAFEDDEKAKKEVGEINKKIYAKDSSIWELYETTRQWSLAYFETIYKRVYSHFDRFYFESETYKSGKETVLKGFKDGVFQESEGAIIFPGSKYGLHDRVFISSEGNPTYEGKDMGLGQLQFFGEYKPELIMHIVGPEQAGYFQVVFEALAQMFPETRGKEFHLIYGWVKLKHGKMSSRTGNVVLGEWLLDEAKNKIKEEYKTIDKIAEQIAVGAVKYSFLKVGLNQEIAFDLEESISLNGNSGPYLQYTFARTQSILRKTQNAKRKTQNLSESFDLQPEEREVLRLLAKFPEVVEEAAARYAPHLVCTYLFDLAQAFNLFYQRFPILKAEEASKAFRLRLTFQTGKILKKGLDLLGIQSPERM